MYLCDVYMDEFRTASKSKRRALKFKNCIFAFHYYRLMNHQGETSFADYYAIVNSFDE